MINTLARNETPIQGIFIVNTDNNCEHLLVLTYMTRFGWILENWDKCFSFSRQRGVKHVTWEPELAQ